MVPPSALNAYFVYPGHLSVHSLPFSSARESRGRCLCNGVQHIPDLTLYLARQLL